MRKFTSILLVLSFLAPNLTGLTLILNYELNKQHITKEYCVNKDKPSMHCNGQCHLMKELKQHDKDQNSSPLETLPYFHLQLLYEAREESIGFVGQSTVQVGLPRYLSIKTHRIPEPLFHPPKLA